MMKRASIRIKGNVQMAGFRTFIKNTADSLNVNGFAENLEDGSVRVVCEGEEATRENEMVTLMRSFDKKGEVMIGFLGSMNETLGSMNETQKGVKEDTSKMLEKQDETIDAIGEVSEKIDGSKEEIVTQISSLRDDLRSYMEYKFAKIEHEVEAIKAKIGMI
jgi:acylphosphatase